MKRSKQITVGSDVEVFLSKPIEGAEPPSPPKEKKIKTGPGQVWG